MELVLLCMLSLAGLSFIDIVGRPDSDADQGDEEVAEDLEHEDFDFSSLPNTGLGSTYLVSDEEEPGTSSLNESIGLLRAGEVDHETIGSTGQEESLRFERPIINETLAADEITHSEEEQVLLADSPGTTVGGSASEDRLVSYNAEAVASGLEIEQLGNVLIGGAGDDTLLGSTFDVLIGGAGNDTFFVNGNDTSITDFNQDEDVIYIALEGGAENVDPSTHSSYQLEDRVASEHAAGVHTISVDGSVVLEVETEVPLRVSAFDYDEFERFSLDQESARDIGIDVVIFVQYQA